MEDKQFDVLEQYFLLGQIDKLIKELEKKKRGYSTNDKIEVQVEMWKKLQWWVNYICGDESQKHSYVFHVNDINDISDGSHSFRELYAHRATLFSVICNMYKSISWKSWNHHHEENFPMYDDYFVVGIDTPEGQYSYHYHKDWWDKFDVPELEEAPKFDGHQPDDVDRLFSLFEQPEEEKNKDE